MKEKFKGLVESFRKWKEKHIDAYLWVKATVTVISTIIFFSLVFILVMFVLANYGVYIFPAAIIGLVGWMLYKLIELIKDDLKIEYDHKKLKENNK